MRNCLHFLHKSDNNKNTLPYISDRPGQLFCRAETSRAKTYYFTETTDPSRAERRHFENSSEKSGKTAWKKLIFFVSPRLVFNFSSRLGLSRYSVSIDHYLICKISENPPSGNDQSVYISNLVLLIKIIPVIADQASDISVLAALYTTGYIKLFYLGLAIDLLPGPVTALQFFLLGFRKACLLLLFHPANIFIHTFSVLLGNSPDVVKFSNQVIEYSRESQSLLESPLQVIRKNGILSLLLLTIILPSRLFLRQVWFVTTFSHFLGKKKKWFKIVLDSNWTFHFCLSYQLFSPYFQLSWMLQVLSILLTKSRTKSSKMHHIGSFFCSQ